MVPLKRISGWMLNDRLASISFDSSQRRQLLSSYVKRVWSLSCDDYQKGRHQFEFFADGCPGIIFQRGASPMLVNDGRSVAHVFLYGQTLQPILLTAGGKCDITIVTFYPDVVYQLFGIAAHELTDTCVDLNSMAIGRNVCLSERMLNAANENARITAMEDFILDRILASAKLDPQVRYATQVIEGSRGTRKISDIARELKFSERTLCRRFEQHVGVVPKVFSSIVKFQTCLQKLGAGTFTSLSSLALDTGYADQSHFNRSFKLYTGRTPLAFLQTAKQ